MRSPLCFVEPFREQIATMMLIARLDVNGGEHNGSPSSVIKTRHAKYQRGTTSVERLLKSYVEKAASSSRHAQ